MKNIFIITATLIVALAVFTVCSGTPKASGADGLDVAIREASDYLNDNISQGSKIVVLNVQSDSTALSEYIIDELIANAVNDKLFEVVDRAQLDLIRTEQNFQLSGEVDDKYALEIGKFFGAQVIVSGRVSQIGSRYRFTIRALEVQTARVVGQNNINIAAGETITTLMKSGQATAGGSGSSGTATATTASGGRTQTTSGTTPAQTVPAQTATPIAPANGTYYFYPRLRATQAGMNIAVYIDRIIVNGNYMTFVLMRTPTGYSSVGNPWVGTGSNNNLLQDLDNPRRTWQMVNHQIGDSYDQSKPSYITFERVTGTRFSLSNTNYAQPYIFNEINMADAEYEP